MKSDTSQTDESPGNEAVINSGHYPQGSWQNASPYTESPYGNSPLNYSAHFSTFMPHGMPSESLSGMPATLHNTQLGHTGHMAHHHLPMLNTTTTWPSELTHTQPPSTYSVPSNTLPPATMSTMCTARPPEKTRKTLSFEQKRDMCLYHQQHPKIRQADIGQVFRVERSTVSKVLRNKEMYLKGDADKDSDGKRANGKNPDFDRTLGNYIRRQRERGIPMSDSDIMDRACQYARGSPNHQAILDRLTPAWLNRFKQRYSIDTVSLIRRASEPSIPEKRSMSARFPSISPSSPSGQTSPLSVSPSDDDLRSRGDYSFTYRQYASHSETSLTDNATSSFSSELISPVGAFDYSPDGTSSAFPLDPEFEAEQKKNESLRPMELDYTSQANTGSTDSVLMTPRNINAVCKQESPAAADTMASIPDRGDDGKVSKVGAGISRTAPSSEDAQRAAATLLNYLQNLGQSGQFDHEYSAIMQLTRKLDIQPRHFAQHGTGGLARIVEGEVDLITAGGGRGN